MKSKQTDLIGYIHKDTPILLTPPKKVNEYWAVRITLEPVKGDVWKKTIIRQK